MVDLPWMPVFHDTKLPPDPSSVSHRGKSDCSYCPVYFDTLAKLLADFAASPHNGGLRRTVSGLIDKPCRIAKCTPHARHLLPIDHCTKTCVQHLLLKIQDQYILWIPSDTITRHPTLHVSNLSPVSQDGCTEGPPDLQQYCLQFTRVPWRFPVAKAWLCFS